jgi:hypothetical protein
VNPSSTLAASRSFMSMRLCTQPSARTPAAPAACTVARWRSLWRLLLERLRTRPSPAGMVALGSTTPFICLG